MTQTIYVNLKGKLEEMYFLWTDPGATKIMVYYEFSFCKCLLITHRGAIISMKSHKIDNK